MIGATIQLFAILCSIVLARSGRSFALNAAERLLERLCRNTAVLPSAFLILAQVKERLGKVQEARSLYEKYLIFRPNDTKALVNLSMIELEGGSLDRCRKLLSLAKEISNNYAIECNLGRVAEAQGELTKALRHYERACAFQNVPPDVFGYHGHLLFKLARWDEAESVYAAALELDKTNLMANVGTANIALQNGDLEKAERYFRKSLRADPNGPGILEGLQEVKRLRDANL